MNVTICEMTNDMARFEGEWQALCNHTLENKSDFLLLPEMPFYKWLAHSDNVDAKEWAMSEQAHDQWIERLGELSAHAVCGTRPVTIDGKRHNEAFVWTKNLGYHAVHHKYYLPDEDGFREATWYEPGKKEFELFEINGVKIGFLICTELWFLHHARDYMHGGIDLLLCPRATPATTTKKWIAGGRTAAVVSGAYCLSANLVGETLGGTGWISEPEDGTVLGRTSPNHPIVTLDLDLDVARNAKSTYPRYVKE
jgi:N-carbamoylputrescine amidase